MKTLLLMIIAQTVAVYTSAETSGNIITETTVRRFQHENGKSVQARILDYKPESNQVTLARENMKTCRLDLDVFSEADQAYVREWHSIRDFFRQECFHISANRRVDKGGIQPLIWQPEEIIIYDITLENRCDFDMKNLTLEYNIYYKMNESGTFERNTNLCVESGRLNIRKLAKGESAKVKTPPIHFPKEDLFEYYRDGKAPPVELLGIRLRIYLPLDSGRTAMREFTNPAALANNITTL